MRKMLFKTKSMPDKRTNRGKIQQLEDGKLAMSIPPNVTCLVYNVNTKQLVLSVVRNFSGSQVILDWAYNMVT